ncbi:1298_t:CDS:10 [Acaulospora morrowiae]|uniref:1298_t:CDS:1 n=1 Tax=Acaulospora morrowiae TaxID=94023 RepID=A0A9N8WGB0_9GLOM|nr:1298_t:CDS:10 [Acaulospora morrowiae]
MNSKTRKAINSSIDTFNHYCHLRISPSSCTAYTAINKKINPMKPTHGVGWNDSLFVQCNFVYVAYMAGVNVAYGETHPDLNYFENIELLVSKSTLHILYVNQFYTKKNTRMDVLLNRTCPREPSVENPFGYKAFHDEYGNFHLPLYATGWIVASAFTFLACVLTFMLIFQHLKNYTKPKEQRLIVRLLLMVPVYTVFDLLAYLFIYQSVYFTTIRDAYQAAAIISFFYLLLEYLGPNELDRKTKISSVQSTRMPFPLCCWHFNPSKHPLFLPALKISAVGIYCKASWSIYFPQIHLVIVQTISSVIANMSMNILFVTVRDDLAHQQLTLKDVCINWALFFVTYQGHALSILVSLSKTIMIIVRKLVETADDVSTGIQSILVSVEFFLISILQLKAFSAQEYRDQPSSTKPSSLILYLLDAINPYDVIKDFIYVVRFIFEHVLLGGPEPKVAPARPLLNLGSFVYLDRPGANDDEVDDEYIGERMPVIDLGEISNDEQKGNNEKDNTNEKGDKSRTE